MWMTARCSTHSVAPTGIFKLALSLSVPAATDLFIPEGMSVALIWARRQAVCARSKDKIGAQHCERGLTTILSALAESTALTTALVRRRWRGLAG